MGDWRDSVCSRQSEKTGAVRVCRKGRWRTLLLRIIAIGLRRFNFALDPGRLMGDRSQRLACTAAPGPNPAVGVGTSTRKSRPESRDDDAVQVTVRLLPMDRVEKRCGS
jgi:hypothetical protein